MEGSGCGQFKTLPRHSIGLIEETTKNSFRIGGLRARDLNSGTSEYEAGVPTTRPQLSIKQGLKMYTEFKRIAAITRCGRRLRRMYKA